MLVTFKHFIYLCLFILFYLISLSNSYVPIPVSERICPDFNFDTEHEVLFCPPLNLIFIHIYKNAGTSVMSYLQNVCTLNYKNSSSSPPFYIKDTYKKIPGVRENVPTTLKEIENFRKNGAFVFTTIRDPIDRFLSGYHEVCRRKRFKYSGRRKKMSNFLIFVKYVERYFRKSRVLDAHLAPQMCFITTKQNQKIPVDLFLAREQIDEVLPQVILRQGGMTFDLVPSEARSRQDPEYRTDDYVILPSMLDSVLVQSICRLYSPDYEYFEFSIPIECNGIIQSYETGEL